MPDSGAKWPHKPREETETEEIDALALTSQLALTHITSADGTSPVTKPAVMTWQDDNRRQRPRSSLDSTDRKM